MAEFLYAGIPPYMRFTNNLLSCILFENWTAVSHKIERDTNGSIKTKYAYQENIRGIAVIFSAKADIIVKKHEYCLYNNASTKS